MFTNLMYSHSDVFREQGDDFDSEDSGGFRAVVLNIRIVSPASKALGVDGHICELVLLPLALAQSLVSERASERAMRGLKWVGV